MHTAPYLLLQSPGPVDPNAATHFVDSLYPAILRSLDAFGAEFQVAVFAILILLLDLCLPVRYSKHLAWVALAACLLPLSGIGHRFEDKGSLFLGMIAIDPFANFFKGLFLAGSIPVILMSYLSRDLEGRRMG